MHYVLLWVLEKSRTAAEYLGTHVPPESFHPSPCFLEQARKGDASEMGISGTGNLPGSFCH